MPSTDGFAKEASGDTYGNLAWGSRGCGVCRLSGPSIPIFSSGHGLFRQFWVSCLGFLLLKQDHPDPKHLGG